MTQATTTPSNAPVIPTTHPEWAGYLAYATGCGRNGVPAMDFADYLAVSDQLAVNSQF